MGKSWVPNRFIKNSDLVHGCYGIAMGLLRREDSFCRVTICNLLFDISQSTFYGSLTPEMDGLASGSIAAVRQSIAQHLSSLVAVRSDLTYLHPVRLYRRAEQNVSCSGHHREHPHRAAPLARDCWLRLWTASEMPSGPNIAHEDGMTNEPTPVSMLRGDRSSTRLRSISLA